MQQIKAIIGLGNPGPRFYYHRHNIGFRVLDELANRYSGHWETKNNMELATVTIADHAILLIKPQTFMNDSGAVIPFLQKKGIKAEQILVVHDELEKPFGSLAFKIDGSHRGHNGLRSIIGVCGPQFMRLRFGIGRPENKDDVPNYVLQPFDKEKTIIEQKIQEAVVLIEKELMK